MDRPFTNSTSNIQQKKNYWLQSANDRTRGKRSLFPLPPFVLKNEYVGRFSFQEYRRYFIEAYSILFSPFYLYRPGALYPRRNKALVYPFQAGDARKRRVPTTESSLLIHTYLSCQSFQSSAARYGINDDVERTRTAKSKAGLAKKFMVLRFMR